MNPFLNSTYQAARAQMDEVVKKLHELTIDIRHDELADLVSELRNRLHEPFMFVVVGEVKSGKSSFVNALLESERDICAVAPDPCTDTIQQIIYGENEQIIEINQHLKKIILPVDILKEIAIVDTPGTNAIIHHHQEITENFIPASDLIVFVFEAKNPYRQSAWEFFDYVHEAWRKKIIFVLQQADLMEAEDLQVNIKGVTEYARKKGILDPQIFAVSAKQEQKGETVHSGFKAVRDHIRAHITGGKAPILKLQNNAETALTVSGRIDAGLHDRQAQYQADCEFREDIRQTLEEQGVRSTQQVDLLLENLLGTYDRITAETKEEISDGLDFFTLVKRSFMSLFGKKFSAKEWFEEISNRLESRLADSLDRKLREGVLNIADAIQQMAKIIGLKIKSSKTILEHDHEVFGYIADRRSDVLKDLQEAFAGMMNKTENFIAPEAFSENSNATTGLATGGGIAVVGVVLTAVTHGAVFDVTGGIITALGLLFAGAAVGIKRRKILSDYQKEIDKGRQKLTEEVRDKLEHYISDIKQKIDGTFSSFDDMLEKEQSQLISLHERHQQITEELNLIKKQALNN